MSENTQSANVTQSEEMKGLDFLTKLVYSCVDRAEELSYAQKRNLLFGMYSFRALFDGEELKRVSKVLVKYGCSFVTIDESASEEEGVYRVEAKSGSYGYKFDAGSPLWLKKVKAGEIIGDNAVIPEKPTLYELALESVKLSSATAELKAMWLVYFPYVFMLGAPVEYDLYDELKSLVHTPEVFSTANAGKYADNICCTREELSGEHPFIYDWYAPFVEWKSVRNDKGISREAAKYQRALALGEFEYAMHGTEKLLDSFPDDEELLLLNISARISLIPTVDFERRVKLLGDNFRIITDAMKLPLKKHVYFVYYRGLTRLGMNDEVGAKDDFSACLNIDSKFEPALLMLKGMDKADELK